MERTIRLSVTQAVNATTQPRGGYLNPNTFEVEQLFDSEGLYDMRLESLHPTQMGLVVDYMTRFMLGAPVREAFMVPIYGARLLHVEEQALMYILSIHDLSDNSIQAACNLTKFDSMGRARIVPPNYDMYIIVDAQTCHNIRIMVQRGISFIEKKGPLASIPGTFEGAYTGKIASGDLDYITARGLWDFKVSKYTPTSKYTLQVLIYYIMGLHSIYHEVYEGLEEIGLFNPRLNEVYFKRISDIPIEIIDKVSKDIIGYC